MPKYVYRGPGELLELDGLDLVKDGDPVELDAHQLARATADPVTVLEPFVEPASPARPAVKTASAPSAQKED